MHMNTAAWRLLLAFAFLIAASPAQALATIYLDGAGGNIVFPAKQTFIDGLGGAKISASTFNGGAGTVSIKLQSAPKGAATRLYYLDFAGFNGQTLKPGKYARSINGGFYVNPKLAFMDVEPAAGQGCAYADGAWFDVLEATILPDNTVLNLAIDFFEPCASSAPLFGAIRINSLRPVPKFGPYAIAGRPQIVDQGWTVRLDGVESSANDGAQPPASMLSYAWKQIAVPVVSLSAATAPNPTFTAPAVPASASGVPLTFRLTVTGPLGLQDTDQVTVTVHNPQDPQTRIYLDSASGEQVGQGQRYYFTEADHTFAVTGYGGGLQITVDTSAWRLAFAPTTGTTFVPGTYTGSRNYLGTSPLMDVDGLGRGCGDTSGSFSIIQVAPPSGSASQGQYAFDFEQYCDALSPPLKGSIRINSAVPLHDGLDQTPVVPEE